MQLDYAQCFYLANLAAYDVAEVKAGKQGNWDGVYTTEATQYTAEMMVQEGYLHVVNAATVEAVRNRLQYEYNKRMAGR